MTLQERRATCAWQGDLMNGEGAITVASGAFPEIKVTFGARTGEAGGTTSPEELIAAAHATCYAMVLSNALPRAGKSPERIEVEAVCTLDRDESGLKITRVDLNAGARMADTSEEEFRELAVAAEQRCPVSNALRGNVDIQVNARLL
jgi:osmotically inducible protein OsmC